ncbi:Piso0_000433 [Millerozyma farinosa CBS 7064]|uniref:Piso0_000433 protein n=1 Tax=Pichia sorbitophila (strain ATCC MYA-4447 / BCRC 22081 / CBS 7064 / NBRC 10061 / NRRL Y-12695) TaxID=559304 RepID=G8YTZ6_PICSO|nr:Piso0_000433 [Millerozyma farinosa CBS 7064]CCE73397.1 Piso0_000433 [Millerozyma farinosa CBS 7064]
MSSPNISDSFLQWDPAQVANYMNSVIDHDEENIGNYFLEHNIDGSLLPFISTEHLKEIGLSRLNLRLQIKKCITDLITSNFKDQTPASSLEWENRIRSAHVNSNYVSMESLSLSTVLLKDMIKKLRHKMISSPESPGSQLDVRKLNENFNKLKLDLIPLIRLVKDSKPLPTPTLDPGLPSTFTESSLFQHSNESSKEDQSGQGKSSGAQSNISTLASSGGTPDNVSSFNSPRNSSRFSTAVVLSTGTGKIAQQAVPKQVVLESRSKSEANLSRSRSSSKAALKQSPSKPTLRSTQSSMSTHTVRDNTFIAPSQTPGVASSSSSQGEPFKQLKASSEDSCLKILQQAMKRHHIPRSDWSKYVLVICYGDKERILKLAEKPVLVFKELQELGKHPAIMLRQLAPAPDAEKNDIYEDSRIGDDIPGGTL